MKRAGFNLERAILETNPCSKKQATYLEMNVLLFHELEIILVFLPPFDNICILIHQLHIDGVKKRKIGTAARLTM